MLIGQLWPENPVFHICGTGTLTSRSANRRQTEGGGGGDEEDNRNIQTNRGLNLSAPRQTESLLAPEACWALHWQKEKLPPLIFN